GRIDVLADEVHADLPAALEGHVGELGPGQGLLQLDREDLVFLRRAGAAHLHLGRLAGVLLDGGEVVFRRLVRRVRVDPQDELVEGQPRDGRQIPPAERDARVERRREEVRQGDDDRVGLTLLALDVQEALGAGSARLVDDDERARRELVLFGDAGDQPRHLVGATAGPGGHHELDRLGRLPGDGGRGSRDQQREEKGDDCVELHCSLLCSGPGPESMSYGIRIEHVYKGPGPVVRARPYRLRAPRRSHGRSGHYFADSAAFVASRRRNGTTAGISHFSHISSTFAWKYARSSSTKWANRPCFRRYSRTGLRARPSIIALVLP